MVANQVAIFNENLAIIEVIAIIHEIYFASATSRGYLSLSILKVQVNKKRIFSAILKVRISRNR